MKKGIDEKRVNDIEASVKEIAKYVRNEAARLEELLEKRSPDREYLERMEKAKEEIDSNLRILQLLKQDVETMRDETENVENKIKKIEEMVSSGQEKVSENIANRLDFLEKEVKESIPTRKRLEEEAVLRMGIEKKVQGLEKRFEDLRKSGIEEQTRKGLEKEVALRMKIEKGLQELENRFKYLEKSGIEEQTRKKEEVSLRMNIEKSLQELENRFKYLEKSGIEKTKASEIEATLKSRLQELERRLRDIETIGYKGKAVPVSDTRILSLERRLAMLEKSSLEKSSEPARDFDKKLELKVSRYLSEQLQNFAETLDKRLPNAALIEDYNKKLSETEKGMKELESTIKADVDKRLVDLNQGMRSIEEKIKSVESPDLSPLANRVALLEKRMVEIIAMMKSFSSRMPVVVE